MNKQKVWLTFSLIIKIFCENRPVGQTNKKGYYNGTDLRNVYIPGRFCPECKQGEMKRTDDNMALLTNPPKYEHACSKCGHIENYTDSYPKLHYQERQEPTQLFQIEQRLKIMSDRIDILNKKVDAAHEMRHSHYQGSFDPSE